MRTIRSFFSLCVSAIHARRAICQDYVMICLSVLHKISLVRTIGPKRFYIEWRGSSLRNLYNRTFEKKAVFDLLFTFFSHQGNVTKILSVHISLTYIHVVCSPYWFFLPYQFWKKKIRIYQVRFLFGMSPGVDFYSRHFGTINK